eukprot:CAMPEP_0184498202 /NCGR_PEP_ID=MMETSP0113_2-20130426/38386_1 /TAXON_ID=91329 /ORGANISM="Norrisiella sphaerica, Strain BC52" /LENGTH=402 /DNA_ID=CAMNT_0026885623 /DNA_START=366 /DNA_END=1571 /DNA_ORIENTATION=-
MASRNDIVISWYGTKTLKQKGVSYALLQTLRKMATKRIYINSRSTFRLKEGSRENIALSAISFCIAVVHVLLPGLTRVAIGRNYFGVESDNQRVLFISIVYHASGLTVWAVLGYWISTTLHLDRLLIRSNCNNKLLSSTTSFMAGLPLSLSPATPQNLKAYMYMRRELYESSISQLEVPLETLIGTLVVLCFGLTSLILVDVIEREQNIANEIVGLFDIVVFGSFMLSILVLAASCNASLNEKAVNALNRAKFRVVDSSATELSSFSNSASPSPSKQPDYGEIATDKRETRNKVFRGHSGSRKHTSTKMEGRTDFSKATQGQQRKTEADALTQNKKKGRLPPSESDPITDVEGLRNCIHIMPMLIESSIIDIKEGSSSFRVNIFGIPISHGILGALGSAFIS